MQEIHDLLLIIGPKRRMQMLFVVALMMAVALVEVAVISFVVPFLSAVMGGDGEVHRLIPLDVPDSLLAGSPGVFNTFVFFLVCLLAATALRLGLAWLGYRLTYAIGVDLGARLIGETLARPYCWHLQHNSEETLSAIIKVDSVMHVLNQLFTALVAVIVGAAIILTLVGLDAKIFSSVAVSLGACYLLLGKLAKRRLERNSQHIAHALGARFKVVQEALGGIREVILDKSERTFLGFFSRHDQQMRRAEADNAFLAVAPRIGVEASGLLILAVLVLVFKKFDAVEEVLPVLGGFLVGLQRLLPQVQNIYLAWSTHRGSRTAISDYLSLLNTSQYQLRLSDRTNLAEGIVGSCLSPPLLELRDVSFRYGATEHWVLNSVCLTVEKGDQVGLVGPSGAGKSTLMDLCLGLLLPTKGQVLIDGDVLDDATRGLWIDRVAHVPQAVYLADLSIAENVAFGCRREDIDEDRVWQALAVADLTDFVETGRSGIWEAVGERGARLSAGQRQRIGIARALYKKIDLLILDEATGALDRETEQKILDAIRRLQNNLAVITISHRESALRYCSRVMQIRHGRIA